jgi:hypothetical protein
VVVRILALGGLDHAHARRDVLQRAGDAGREGVARLILIGDDDDVRAGQAGVVLGLPLVRPGARVIARRADAGPNEGIHILLALSDPDGLARPDSREDGRQAVHDAADAV